MRPCAIGRKNWLFVGSDRGGETAATCFSILAGAKRHRIEPFAYVRDLLVAISMGEPDWNLLLPDVWIGRTRSTFCIIAGMRPRLRQDQNDDVVPASARWPSSRARPRDRWIQDGPSIARLNGPSSKGGGRGPMTAVRRGWCARQGHGSLIEPDRLPPGPACVNRGGVATEHRRLGRSRV